MSAPDDRDPQTAIDEEAEATVTAIAGLRRRLRRQEILEHPKVRNALLILQELVEEQMGEADRRAGRHRSTAGKPVRQVNDASGFDQKPDPLTVTTPAEFIQMLWKYKYWSGDPSWRAMANNANHMVVHSTMHAAMNSEALPKFAVMKAIIIGCGGDDEDMKAFASAWRRVGGLVTLR